MDTLFSIFYEPEALDELARLRAFDSARIMDTVRKKLRREPMTETTNIKKLSGLVPPWDQVGPVWELRVDEFRVFYDPNPEELTVIVRAVRYKPPEKTTKEIL